jgi:hypothetical protein
MTERLILDDSRGRSRRRPARSGAASPPGDMQPCSCTIIAAPAR